MSKEIVIVSAARTPIGSFRSLFKDLTAPRLAAAAIKKTLNQINLSPSQIDEVILGCALQAGIGQSPARQAALAAGLVYETPCTTINKVCASGMKSVMMAASAIKAGDAQVVMAGGMESMSRVPHYLMNSRSGQKLGDMTLTDGMLFDGLTDIYSSDHMGLCGELCAEQLEITRREQDEFALKSYSRARDAWKNGWIDREIAGVTLPDGQVITQDEEFCRIKEEKVPLLRPAFKKDGTITAANASKISDGASAILVMSADRAKALGLKPLARIVAYADAGQKPELFPTTPVLAINKILEKTGLSRDEIDFWELNEAFSVVGVANIKMLDLDDSKVNIFGGAVSLGHPLGSSGGRIIVSLLNILHSKNGRYGMGAICNGGGGASAILLERII